MTRPRQTRAARPTGDLILLELLRLSQSLRANPDREASAERYAVHADELLRRLDDPTDPERSTIARIVAANDPDRNVRKAAQLTEKKIREETE